MVDYTDFAPPKASFPWKWVMIGAAILVVIGILVGGGVFLLPKVFIPPPDKTVVAFYEALNAQDFEKASTFMDHSSGEVITDLPVTFLKQEIEQLGGDALDTSLDITFQFQGLSFQTLSQDKTSASVAVQGNLRLIEINTNFNLTLPYNYTHELTYQNGKWLIKP